MLWILQKNGSVVEWKNNVSNLSAQKKKKSQKARVFKKDEVCARQKYYQKKAPKRQIQACCRIKMLPKRSRLNRKELSLFFKQKYFFKKGAAVLLRYQRKQKHKSKVAFVVSGPKKSAVARNLAKRRMSEIVASAFNQLPKSYDMVFSFKLGQDKKVPSADEFKKDIVNVISTLNI